MNFPKVVISFDPLKITRKKKVPRMAGIIIYFLIPYYIFKNCLLIWNLIKFVFFFMYR